MEPESKPKASRRDLLRLASASLAAPLAGPLAAQVQPAPRPFKVNIPQSTVDRILTRVKQAHWADRLDASDWRYGTNWDYMKDLAQYWTTKFDWRKAEAALNRYPQFLARVGDFDIHFYHVRARGSNGFPILLT